MHRHSAFALLNLKAMSAEYYPRLDWWQADRAETDTCEAATAQQDNRWVRLAGLVLVRQKPGSAKVVMFITLEDKTGVANLVIWPNLCEKERRLILTASMIGVEGRVQREGEVIHVIASRLHDLSLELAGLGERDGMFSMPHGRGDGFHNGSAAGDSRDRPVRMVKPRDIYIPDIHVDTLKGQGAGFSVKEK